MSNKTPRKQPEETESAPKYLRFSSLIFLVFGFLFLLFFSVLTLISSDNDKNKLVAPQGKIYIEFADTGAERIQGLSGRESVPDDYGLMFIFDETSVQNCFWMKDMKFSIDMIWLDDNKKVVTVAERVSPETYPETFCPSSPAKYGLEIQAGTASSLGIFTDQVLAF